MRAPRSSFARLLKSLLLSPLEDAFIPLKDLPPALQALGACGYMAILLMLVLMVVSVFGGAQWGQATFTSLGKTVQVPLLVLIAAVAGLLASWAFILTGASDCPPLVFIPACLLFGADMLFLATFSNLFLLSTCAVLPLLLGVMGAHAFTYKKPFWQKYPLLEFFLWSLLLLLIGGLFWLGRQPGTSAYNFMGVALDPFFIILLPLWLLFGLSVVDLAINLARWIVTSLRKLFPGSVIQALAAFALVARLAAVPLWVILANRQGFDPTNLTLQQFVLPAAMLLDMGLTFPLLIGAVVLLLRRRWSRYNAAVLLALCLAAPVFSLGLMTALGGYGDISNMVEMTLTSTRVLPSVIIFVVMLTYNVLGLGSRFAAGDGRRMPRRGRILLVLGVGLLVTTLAAYQVNLLDPVTSQPATILVEAFNDIFCVSLMGLGLPYMAWILWKHPERLAGKRAEFEALKPRWQPETRLSPSFWPGMGAAAGLLLVMFACLGMLLFFAIK